MKQFLVLVVIASSVFHAAAVKPPAPKTYEQKLFEFEYYQMLTPQKCIKDASEIISMPGITLSTMKHIRNDLIGVLEVQRDTLSSQHKLKIGCLVDAFNARREREKRKN